MEKFKVEEGTVQAAQMLLMKRKKTVQTLRIQGSGTY